MYYYGIVEIDNDGSASGYFPSVPGCYFAGENLKATYEDAESAIDAHFELLAEKEQEIPRCNELPVFDKSDPATSRLILICLDIDITRYLGNPERINITMPQPLIAKIDKVVGKDSRYKSRSHFIAEAARKELSHL